MKITPIKELRKVTKLSQKDFSEKYQIPLKTLQNWESDVEKREGRKCPSYVFSLLKRAVSEDFPNKEINDPLSRLKCGERLKIDERHERALRYSLAKIKDSEISKYVDDVILYGSCARGNATEDSDVDILMVLKDSIKSLVGYDKLLRNLRSDVSTSNIKDAETDIHYSYGDEWRYSPRAYFLNLRKDGVSVWN